MFRLPPQIVRLVLLTVGIVGTYVLARMVLTPASFGQYGWYRGDALMELASRPVGFAGKASCVICHTEQAQKLAKAGHNTLSCESCHGPLQRHAADPVSVKLKKDETISDCLRCHQSNPSRPKWHKQIVAKDHYTGDKCTDCHPPHVPIETQ
jgi:hypothetical protein